MMRLLAWAAWACAEAAGVAFVERIVSAYAPNVAAIFAADANGDGRIEVWSAADGAYGLRSYEHNWRHDLPDEYDTYVLESGSAWVDVVAADFDGDGALEVAAATSAAVSGSTASKNSSDGRAMASPNSSSASSAGASTSQSSDVRFRMATMLTGLPHVNDGFYIFKLM